MKDNKSAYTSSDYDANVNKVLPYYNEFHRQIIDAAKCIDADNLRWLDLGCGTGTLACKATNAVGNCKFTLCDISEPMLKTAEEKLKNSSVAAEYINCSNDKINFSNEFDIVSAVMSNHYFKPEQRKAATKNAFNALKPGGIYITFENVEPQAESVKDLYIKRWGEYMLSAGRSQDEIENHFNRRGTEYFPITVSEHLYLLKECGFKSAEILWYSYMQAGFLAIK